MLFHEIQGGIAILKNKGVYKQVDLFDRGGRIYAKHGGGYIGLKQHEHGTTVPTIRWEHVEGVEFAFSADLYGDMVRKDSALARKAA